MFSFDSHHQGALGDLYRSMAPLQKELTAPVPSPYLTTAASYPPVPSIGTLRMYLLPYAYMVIFELS